MLAYTLGLTLVVCTGTIYTVETVIQVTGIEGSSVLLSPELPPGFDIRDIFWRHLSPTDHMVASFSRGSTDTTYQSCFYGRVQLLQNFTLEIMVLELKDTGIFTCQMVDTDGHMRLHQFYLTVYEAVAVPEVQVYTKSRGTHCTGFLSCNTTIGNNVTYSWRAYDRQGDPQNSSYTLYDDDRLLRFLLAPSDRELAFTCTATNPVSQEQRTVVPWSSCPLPQGGDSSRMVIFISVFLAVAFISMMFCVYLCTRNSDKNGCRKRARNENAALKAEEETVLQGNEETATLQNEWLIPPNVETELHRNHETILSCNIETTV